VRRDTSPITERIGEGASSHPNHPSPLIAILLVTLLSGCSHTSIATANEMAWSTATSLAVEIQAAEICGDIVPTARFEIEVAAQCIDRSANVAICTIPPATWQQVLWLLVEDQGGDVLGSAVKARLNEECPPLRGRLSTMKLSHTQITTACGHDRPNLAHNLIADDRRGQIPLAKRSDTNEEWVDLSSCRATPGYLFYLSTCHSVKQRARLETGATIRRGHFEICNRIH
jgi:hypothetical protein